MRLSKGIKIPRNSPCSCGSGLKYKKCCLKKQQEQLEKQLNARRISEEYKKKLVEDKKE